MSAAEKDIPQGAGLSPLLGLVPGLVLTCAIAAIALGLHNELGIATLSPLLLSIVIGIGVGNLMPLPAVVRPGISFSLKRVLRLAVILLGLQLTFSEIGAIGLRGILIVTVTLGATFMATKAMGQLLGVERRLSELIAAGTSVCGASAVLATNLVTGGRDEDVAYAVACVTVFGTLAMLLDPVIAHAIGLGAVDYGLWTGGTIHEVAQVVAAAFQDGTEAGHVATVAKLGRVILLAPLVLWIGFIRFRDTTGPVGQRPPLPWFVFGFLAMVGFNSLVSLPAEAHQVMVTVTTFLLGAALAAMGLETNIVKLKAEGLRPLLLGALAWVFISVFGLALVMATAG
ncbi:YeiH family protein [Hartmannibacter diazotrophicus]|nr:YeiH family protein [Hartmannibacter diazotrophicus]